VSHLVCHVTSFNLVYTHDKKFEVSCIVKEVVNLIKTRFNAKIIFIRLDEKKILKIEFKNFLIETRISFESFASRVVVELSKTHIEQLNPPH
jgi:hypothetical protein